MAYSPHYQHVFSARNAEISCLFLRIIDANQCFKVGYRQGDYRASFAADRPARLELFEGLFQSTPDSRLPREFVLTTG